MATKTVLFAKQGRPGQGARGKGLYDYWLDEGNVGSPAQMLADMKGDGPQALAAAQSAVEIAEAGALAAIGALETADTASAQAGAASAAASAAAGHAQAAAESVADKASLLVASTEAEALAAPAGTIAIFGTRMFHGGIEITSPGGSIATPPTATVAPGISAALVEVGTVVTVTEGEWTPAPVALTGRLMLGTADVTGQMTGLSWLAAEPGRLTWTVTPEGGAPVSASAEVAIRASGTGMRVRMFSGVETPQADAHVLTSLSAADGRIVDQDGNVVVAHGTNWHGLEGTVRTLVGAGASMDHILGQMWATGVRVLRVPITAALMGLAATPANTYTLSNPALEGLTPVQVLHALLDRCGAWGIMVILDMHRIEQGTGPQRGPWYKAGFALSDMVAAWQAIVTEFGTHAAVIGCDLFNEPAGTSRWGADAANPVDDWRAAATTIGNAILAINPNLLIIVEGVSIVGGVSDWAGSNLRGIQTSADLPQLIDMSKLVLSVHAYANGLVNEPPAPVAGITTKEGFRAYFNANYGHVVALGVPIIVGECGAEMSSDLDRLHTEALREWATDIGGWLVQWSFCAPSPDSKSVLTANWLIDDKTVSGVNWGAWRRSLIMAADRYVMTGMDTRPDWLIYEVTLDALAPVGATAQWGLTELAGSLPTSLPVGSYRLLDRRVTLVAGERRTRIRLQVDPAEMTGDRTARIQLSYTNPATVDGYYDLALREPAALPIVHLPENPIPQPGGAQTISQGAETVTVSDVLGTAVGADGVTYVRIPAGGATVTRDTVRPVRAAAAGSSGAMLNPRRASAQGFDSAISNYSGVAAAAFPLSVVPGDTLVLARSRTDIDDTTNAKRNGILQSVERIEFVTALPATPARTIAPAVLRDPAGARLAPFDVNLDALVAGLPAYPVSGFTVGGYPATAAVPVWADIQSALCRHNPLVRMNDSASWSAGSYEVASINGFGGTGTNYGQVVHANIASAALLLISDGINAAQKRTLLTWLIRHGLDWGDPRYTDPTKTAKTGSGGADGGHWQFELIPEMLAWWATGRVAQLADFPVALPNNQFTQTFQLTPAQIADLAPHADNGRPYPWRRRTLVARGGFTTTAGAEAGETYANGIALTRTASDPAWVSAQGMVLVRESDGATWPVPVLPQAQVSQQSQTFSGQSVWGIQLAAGDTLPPFAVGDVVYMRPVVPVVAGEFNWRIELPWNFFNPSRGSTYRDLNFNAADVLLVAALGIKPNQADWAEMEGYAIRCATAGDAAGYTLPWDYDRLATPTRFVQSFWAAHAEAILDLSAPAPDPAVVPIVPAGQTIKIAQLAQSHATVGKKPSTTLVRPALPAGQKIEVAWSDYTTQAARYWDSDTGDSTAVPPTYLGYAITARMLHDYPMQIAILDREGSTPAGLLDYEPTASGDWTPTYWENRVAAKDAAGMTPDILSIDWYPGGTHAPFYANAANPAGTDVAEMWRAFATGLNPVTSAAISVGQPTTFYGSKSWIFDHAFWADLPGIQHVLLPPVQDVDQRRALAAGDDFWPQQLRQQMREPYLCEGNTTINGHPDPHSEFGALLMGSIYAIIHAQRLGVPGSHPSRIAYTVYGNGAVVTSVDGPLETAAHKRGWTGDEYAAASTHLDRFSQNALIEVGGWWWDLGGATGYDVAYTALLRPRATRIVGNGIVVEAPQGVTLTSTARLRWIPSRDHPATIPGRDIGAPAMVQPEGRDVVDVVPIWGTGASPIVPAEIPASWAAIVSPLPSIRPGLLHVGTRADLSLGGSLNAVSVSNQLTLDGAAVVIANDAMGDFFSPTAPGELRLTTTVSNAIGGETKDATALVLAVGARYGRGIELDGNNRYAMATTRAGEARGLVSLFFRATSWNTPSQQRIFSAGGLEIRQTSSARLAFRFNHASSLVTEILTTGWTSNIWHHVLLSWDHEANRLQIWRNGVSIYSAGFTYTEALTMVGTAANARVAGAASPSDAKLIGSIGHVLYEPGAEYDLADAYVRSLLIDPDGYPMWWGADASQLLGRPALVYCDGASAATWGNKGDVTMAPGTWSTAPTAMAATQPVAGNS